MTKKSPKKRSVGIIGLGYVGLPLWINFAQSGAKVIGFDVDQKKVDLLNKGKTYIEHISAKSIKESVALGAESTTDFKFISELELIIICVPTPISKHNEPDLSFVRGVLDLCGPHLKKNQIISLESTTYPGTTEEILLPRIENYGFTVGKDFHLVYSPERENPGGDIEQSEIPKLIGGYTKLCLAKAKKLYGLVFKEIVEVPSVKIAELAKLLENIHRAVNIGMINEFKIICDKMGVDTYDVVKAASSKPFGFVPYYPGPGWGGHCIPVDPFYFSWKAKEFGVNARFIELAGELNNQVIDWVIAKAGTILNLKKQSLSGSKILLLGLSYKENVDDARESPSIKIYKKLINQGAKVDYSDPHFKKFPDTRIFDMKKSNVRSISLSASTLKKYDLVILLTKHKKFDYQMIKKYSNFILDTRGAFSPDNKKIFRG